MTDPAAGVVAGNFHYAKGAYQQMLLDSQKTGKCIFCGDAFRNDPEYPVLDREGGWYLRERTKSFPSPDRAGNYPALYLMLVRDQHGEELTDEDWVAIGRLFRRAQERFQIPGGGLCMRFGGTLGGRTIYHHHLHLIQPNQAGVNQNGQPKAIPWDFPVG